MVDYQDLDGDNDPDEMDIRYFTNGRLNNAWFGEDLDDDGLMWSLRGYEYSGESYFESDPYGDNIFYMGKFNPVEGTWLPISECPFAFYDTDNDGYAEEVVRVSAVPLGYDPAKDPDYANSAFGRPWEAPMAKMGIVNIRYSFDIDNGSNKERPLHYEFGFNLVGKTPYDYPGMNHFNRLRRPPQTTIVVPWKTMRAVADSYPARETGFTWHENFDDTMAIGFAGYKAEDWRWEGVFWVWERRFMENTGGPNQKWNVRREWMSKPASSRELYYSDVDKRIHLFGAEEGWIQIGDFSGLGPIGEIRMYDTDGNGYFDRWETYRSGDAAACPHRERPGREGPPARVQPGQAVRLLRGRGPAQGEGRQREAHDGDGRAPAVHRPRGAEDGHGHRARELPAVRAGRGPGAPVPGLPGVFRETGQRHPAGRQHGQERQGVRRRPPLAEAGRHAGCPGDDAQHPYRLAAGASPQGPRPGLRRGRF